MKILLTLDYELFLGSKTGSVEKSLIEPMDAYVAVLDKYDAKFTIFVDATYLCVLKKYAKKYDSARIDYEKIESHIRNLHEKGHDIQLHVHPHWFFSKYDGNEWVLDSNHYKLCDLEVEDALKIFIESKELLDGIIGKKTIAFRVGGFSTQPTELLTKLFQSGGIKIDSSVCPGNYYDSPQQKYDYLNAPNEDIYRFGDDICSISQEGKFIEVPITTHKVSPLFYWRVVLNKFIKSDKHRLYGDGCAVKTTSESIIERLTKFTSGMATIDGFKIKCLNNAYEECKRKGKEVLCIIGHPKLATKYSVDKLDRFCRGMKEEHNEFVTISYFYED